MWKIIREVLALIWKLIRTLLKNRLRAIIKRLLLFMLLAAGFVALVVFVLTRVF
ncbi:MAG: hypothetical protein IPM54_01100 [Polyangiaceae bacterium]|nr:hypothetical protein [Polyangiaceae bacterium]